jgi:hypothetical protein
MCLFQPTLPADSASGEISGSHGDKYEMLRRAVFEILTDVSDVLTASIIAASLNYLKITKSSYG